MRARPFRRSAAAGLAVLAVGTPVAYAALGADLPEDARPATADAARSKDYAETRLFFGSERPGGGPDVTGRQFLGFVRRRAATCTPTTATGRNASPVATGRPPPTGTPASRSRRSAQSEYGMTTVGDVATPGV